MAEKGAYLSSLFVKKPSIFELIAQDSLANTFHPTLRHIINFFVSRNPNRYAFLLEWIEELHLGFQLLFQSHYLRNYDGTFSERFYSLKRIEIKCDSNGSIPGLPLRLKLLSVFFSVLFPYLRMKWRIMAENIENNEEYKNKPRIPPEYRSSFVRLYKTCHFIIEVFSTMYYIQYMTGRAETHSPFLQLAGVTLIYSHDEPKNGTCWKTVLKNFFSGNWKSTVDLLRMLKGFLGYNLELLAFFVQFMNWWHSEQLHAKFFAYPIPPAPHSELMKTMSETFSSRDEKAFDCDYVVLQFSAGNLRVKNLCPLCDKPFQIPSALPVSGYVYCFVCIRKYLAQHRRCPVTRLPALEEDLVRIYANASDIQ